MTLILIGLNHKSAPVEIRELVAVSERDTDKFLEAIRATPGIRGASVLSTCNRVETLVSADHEDVIESLVSQLAARAPDGRDRIEDHLYILRHRDVVRHVFRVASGLDSMIVGEPQISGQVRASYLAAAHAGTLDGLLLTLHEHALRVSKKVRTETGIGEHAVSVPYAAVELARKIFGDLRGLQVLLVGAGEIGELTAQHLSGFGLSQIFVANRAFDRAEQLASRFGGQAVQYDAIEEKLSSTDIVISSTAAPHFVITASQIERVLGTKKRRDLFLIDLSVPRNLDPAIGKLEGAYLYNIDDLKEVVDGNRARRFEKAHDADGIIEKEVDAFFRRIAATDAVPTIVELQRRLEEIRSGELEKCLRRLGPISSDQREAIDTLTTSIVNKILHYPILRLKESASDHPPNERDSFRDTLRKIFGLR